MADWEKRFAPTIKEKKNAVRVWAGGMALGLVSLDGMNAWTGSVRRILPKNSTKRMRPPNGVMGFEVLRKCTWREPKRE
jgi:hypothetical protein